jgi:hypothetical protein
MLPLMMRLCSATLMARLKFQGWCRLWCRVDSLFTLAFHFITLKRRETGRRGPETWVRYDETLRSMVVPIDRIPLPNLCGNPASSPKSGVRAAIQQCCVREVDDCNAVVGSRRPRGACATPRPEANAEVGVATGGGIFPME